ncbi:uncharacterized protein FA14DRAFT_160396 [Meira miltonrushii]|uniref:DUF202 domain-containing protein n=1 Tax=Meira miltonrushii TaxID=1280837 RepID=A0A316VBZ1_9BASI|nr:uncharacterized protein FA14DRAFT_160396 [Meira miltonrushii]PWN35082.1 hypothetical protein FA14DRAFT_160396 [Meira miltonrushii]
MTSSPKAMGGGEEGGFASPRLTLHIPNSYPRNFSPRGSPNSGSPSARSVNIPVEADSPKKDDMLVVPPSNHRLASSTSAPGALAGTSDGALLPAFAENDTQPNNHTRIPDGWASLMAFFNIRQTTAESARDFLARERTFFSWLRLSSMLAIGSAALFLRLQLRDLSQVIGHGHHKVRVGKGMYTAGEGDAIIQALRMQAMRKNLLRQQSVLVSSTSVAKIGPSASILVSDPERNLLDTSVALSEALGILFFALSIFSLIIGWIDYMRCVRALEHADEVVPVMANRTANNTDDDHPSNLERRAVAQRYHDARHARQAHSTKVVYITEVIVAFVIFATALTILLTNHKASIAPPSPF